MFSGKDLERWADRFVDQAEDKMLETLKYTGEHFVTLARDAGGYHDQTGNLRSSIGYVVVKDGVIKASDFKPTDKGTEDGTSGLVAARRLAQKLALTHNKGFVLIGMAGMDYAIVVEQEYGKDVIAGSQKEAEKMLRQLVKKING